jgi:hypothetical protein
MTALLGGGVARWLVAASSRPRSGPFGPHLGLGGLDPCIAVPSPAAGGVARAGGGRTATRRLQRGDGSLTSLRARPGQVGLVCSCAASGLLAPLAGEVVPSCVLVVQPLLAPGCLFSIRRSRFSGHG